MRKQSLILIGTCLMLVLGIVHFREDARVRAHLKRDHAQLKQVRQTALKLVVGLLANRAAPSQEAFEQWYQQWRQENEMERLQEQWDLEDKLQQQQWNLEDELEDLKREIQGLKDPY